MIYFERIFSESRRNYEKKMNQPVRCTVCSYQDTLVFTFGYDLVDMSVQRGFFRRLTADGIEVEIESNGMSYG